tara:strand:- start:793 stop:1305 length:513 start_codon:yes stop_codon:yes gene_type:complete
VSDNFLDEILGNGASNTDAYYHEEQNVTIDDGTYPATVIDLNKSNVTTRYGTNADLYKPTYQIAKGKNKGATISDKGIWRFKSEPSQARNKSSRGNIIYKNILDILSIELEQVEVDGVIMRRLPELTKENVVGKKVLITVSDDDYKSNYGRLASKVAMIHSEWADEVKQS